MINKRSVRYHETRIDLFKGLALEISWLKGLQNNFKKSEILELLHIHSEQKQTLIGSKVNH